MAAVRADGAPDAEARLRPGTRDRRHGPGRVPDALPARPYAARAARAPRLPDLNHSAHDPIQPQAKGSDPLAALRRTSGREGDGRGPRFARSGRPPIPHLGSPGLRRSHGVRPALHGGPRADRGVARPRSLFGDGEAPPRAGLATGRERRAARQRARRVPPWDGNRCCTMTDRTHPLPADERVERLVHLARQAPAEHLTPREWAGLHRLERTLLEGTHRRRTPVWVRWIALASILGAIVAGLSLRLRERALTFEVMNATVSDGGYILARGLDASVRFSDRSELGADPGTRLRVSRLEAHGARVMLE